MSTTPTRSQLPLPPGSNGLPLLGETLQFVFDPQFNAKRYQKYGPVFRSHLLGTPVIVMTGPEAAKTVLSSHFEHFNWGDGWPQNFKDLLGRSLFLQDGEEHKRNRKLMMPAFHGKALAGYVSLMDEIITRYLTRWENLGRFAWFPENKQLTFEIASRIFLGADPGADVARLSNLFHNLTNGLFGLVRHEFYGLTSYGKGMHARRELLEFVNQAVAERQKNPGLDALSLLIQAEDEEGHRFNTEELAAQALLMLFAGHETTTSMLTSLVMELSANPAVLEKARAEQQTLNITGAVNSEHTSQMPYLDKVLREVERLHPPVAGGFRGVVKALDFNGYHIPAGWRVQYSILGTHRNASYTNPESFDPERFSPTREEHKKQPFSLIGFGGGPRICVGMAFAQLELKIVASHLLRHYQWQPVPKQNYKRVYIPTLHPKDGFIVNFSQLTPATKPVAVNLKG